MMKITREQDTIKTEFWNGTWVAQLVKHPTLAQVMISQFMGLNPTSGSALTVPSLLGILILLLSLPLPCSLSQKIE